jgi:uncharacterized protein (TIGR01777 family)
MNIAISGSSGFVGSALTEFLTHQGHTILPLRIRPTTSIEEIHAVLEKSEVVINLSGASILGRWSEKYKKILRHSRLDTTQKIVDALRMMSHPPHTFINASAVGIYDSIHHHTEDSIEFADDFLATLVQEWEGCALRAQSSQTRVCCTRFGVVYGKGGGAMAKMLPPFRWGLGGKMGSADQMVSWVHIDDLVRIYDRILHTPSLQGIINVTAPHPLTNRDQTAIMGQLLHRPTFCTIPSWVVKALFGEGSSVMLESKTVTSAVLEEMGFVFTYPTFEKAFGAIIAS